ATPYGIDLGAGDGTFRNPLVSLDLPDAAGSYSAIVAGDFNGDGKLDLALTDGTNNTVVVLMGNGDGTFRCPAEYPVGQGPASLVVGDFTGDGKPDLAVSDSGGVQMLLGNGNGTFQPATTVAAGISGAMVAGDFSGNGALDVAVADESSSVVSILLGN